MLPFKLLFTNAIRLFAVFAPTPYKINYSSSLKIKVTELIKDAKWDYNYLNINFREIGSIFALNHPSTMRRVLLIILILTPKYLLIFLL